MISFIGKSRDASKICILSQTRLYFIDYIEKTSFAVYCDKKKFNELKKNDQVNERYILPND